MFPNFGDRLKNILDKGKKAVTTVAQYLPPVQAYNAVKTITTPTWQNQASNTWQTVARSGFAGPVAQAVAVRNDPQTPYWQKQIGNYVQNRYVQPVRDIPKNAVDLFAKDRSLLDRGKSALGLLGGVATFIPDPIQDVAMPAADFVKGMNASGLRGGRFGDSLRAGIESATLEKPVGLGTALTTDPMGEMIGNIAEIPLTMGLAYKYNKGQTVGFDKSTVDRFKNTIMADPEARSIVQQFSTLVDSSPKKDLGDIGKDAQIFVEQLFGKNRAGNLTNKQIKNIFDVLYQQAETGNAPVKRLPFGLSTQNIREPQTLNVDRLKVTKKQKEMLNALDDEPRIVLKNKDVINEADLVEGRNAPVDIEATKKKLAGQLVSRQKVVTLEREFTQLQRSGAKPEVLQKKIEEIARQSKIARTEGTEAGRILQARNILADAQATPMQKIFRLLDNAGVDEKAYLKDASKVNFDNANEVVNFYRKYVPPTASDWIDVVRYNSMLSSPLTHISNIASNAINSSTIVPIEKTITGAVDFLGSKIIGKKQTQFAGEGLEYAKGYFSKLGEAKDRFLDVIRGKNSIKNLDLDYMPVGENGKLGKKLAHLQIPTKLLDGMDQFFMALTEGGERSALKYRQSKGIKVPELETTATNNASYRLFRSETHDKRQGHLLNAVDDVTDLISRARNSDNPITRNIAKFTLPFVRTPMNIIKQGIEYGPQGLLTLPGAKNKTEQISKALMGSSAMMMTEMLFQSGRTTWAEPTDPKKKQAFRDAGLQPYSIKIGDKWISYQKLPPALSFPIAIVSALHDAQENKTIDENGLDVVLETIAKSGKFFADQSYLKNIGDLINLIGKDPEKIASFVGNYPQQLVPWRALMSWMARMTDPYQRKVTTDSGFLKQQTEQFLMSIPFASQTVPTRDNEFGEPIKNQNRFINAFSPFKVTTENTEKKDYYDTLQQKTLLNRNKEAIKKMVEDGKEIPANAFDVSASDITSVSSGNKLIEKGKKDAIKTKLESGLKVTNEELEKVYTDEINSLPETNQYEKSIKQDKRFELYGKVQEDENLSAEQKKYLTEKMGINSEDAKYYDVAKQDTEIKYAYVRDQIGETADVEELKNLRRTVNGKQILSNAVIDQMYDDELITYDEKKRLKSIGEDLQVKKKTGGASKTEIAKIFNEIKSAAKPMSFKLKTTRTSGRRPVSARISRPKMKEFSYQGKSFSLKRTT